MTYGQGAWGFGPYGGAAGELVLVSSSPSHGTQGVSASFAPLTFLFSSPDEVIDSDLLEIDFNGVSVLQLGGVWSFGGYSGSLTLSDSGTTLDVSVSTHPAFSSSRVTVFLRYGERTWIVEFNTALRHATFKRAKSDCGGLRVDLSFDTGDAVLVRVVRSKVAYADHVTDPGETLYFGAYASVFDGLVDGVYSGPLSSTNKPLERATFYYYSLFTYFSLSGQPEAAPLGHVQGLSIPDYFSEEGYYVYDLLPPEMRQRDADGGALGEKKYELRNLCQLMQCATNLIRGQIEALGGLRDPDMVPAGLTGVPELQQGVLSAFVQDLGFSAERSFDAGVLRRLALGIIPALQRKGTCDGLRMFASVFTGWGVTACREEGDAVCGRVRYVSTWSADVNGRCGWAGVWFPYVGYTEVYKGALREPVTSLSPPDIAPFIGSVPTVLADSFGGVVCVATVLDNGDRWRFVHVDPTSRLRDRAFVSVAGGVTRFQDIAGPWNHPVTSLPYDKDAFAGAELRYGVGLAFTTTVTAHAAGDAVGRHAATFAPSALVDQTAAALYPKYPDASLRMYQGRGTVLPALHWDVGLLHAYDALSLWTVFTGGGSPLGGYAPTPNTARVTVEGVSTKHEVSYASEEFLRLSPGTLAPGAHVGDYLLANFKYPRVYRIVGNSDDEVHVTRTYGDPELNVISEPGSQAVVLSPSDALKYQQLARLITQFVPVDCDVVIDFA